MEIYKRVGQLKSEIQSLQQELSRKQTELKQLLNSTETDSHIIDNNSPPEDKVKLFRSLFKGRDDVYAVRFESKKTGRSGYQPSCNNEWVPGICQKPKIKCKDCNHKDYRPITDNEITFHLKGEIDIGKEYIMGIYPLLKDETCYFLAIDFDKENWRQDSKCFMTTCHNENIPAYLERSRSGNGAHIWIFFEQNIKASLARKLGSILMTKTLDIRPEIELESFDRFFPNQDTMPRGGFGNLIALPLQKKARIDGNTVFLDEHYEPYSDQWLFLSGINKIKKSELEKYIEKAQIKGELLPLCYRTKDVDTPWEIIPESVYPAIIDPIPEKIEMVLSN